MSHTPLIQRLTAAARAFLAPSGGGATRPDLPEALECSDDAITITGANGCLTYFNSRFPAFYPLVSHDIALGVSFRHLLLLAAERGQFHGVGSRQAAEWVQARLQRQVIAESSFEQMLSDGRWIEVVERRLPQGGHIAIRRDITLRKEREQRDRGNLHLALGMVDAIPYPVYVRDLQGKIVTCNRKFAEASGHNKTAIIGKPITAFLPPDQAQEIVAKEDELLALGRGEQHQDVTARWFDGSLRHLSLTRTILTHLNGSVFGCLGILVDITAQKRAEERLVQQTRLTTSGQIASEMAHEINQPLSIIRLAAEDCLEQQRNHSLSCETAQRKLEQIVGQVSRLSELVDQLRGFSRPDQSRPIPFSLVRRVTDVVELVKAQFRLDDIALSLDVAEDCPDILGRPNQMEQVLLNLLTNAREALCQGGKPGTRWVGVRVCCPQDQVILTVEDNGPGIPPSLLPSIFEPFVTTKAEQAGTGLGLSICAGIISGMGGTLQAENLHPGTRFTITLPQPPAVAAASTGSMPAFTPDPLPSLPRVSCSADQCTVLLVDDEPLALECLHDILRRQSYQVLTARRASEALTLLSTTPCHLLITDYRMPGTSGLELLRQARQHHPTLPAILMSGDNISTLALPDRVTCVDKPVQSQILLNAVASLLPVTDTPL